MIFLKQFIQKKTLKKSILIFTLIIILLPSLLIGISSYAVFKRIVLNFIVQTTTDLLKKNSNSIEYSIDQINNVIDLPLYSSLFLELNREVNSSSESTTSDSRLSNYLQMLCYSNNYIHSIILITNNNKQFIQHSSSAMNIKQNEINFFLKNEFNDEGFNKWQAVRNLAFPFDIEPELIVNYRLLKDPFNLEPLGYFFINLYPSFLTDTYSTLNISKIFSFFVVDNEDRIITPIDNSRIAKSTIDKILNKTDETKAETGIFYRILRIDNEDYIVFSTQLDRNEWRLINISKLKDLLSEVNLIKWFMLAIMLISIVVLGFLGVRFSKHITGPLSNLLTNITQLKHGNFAIEKENHSYEEINTITRAFEEMTHNLQDLMHDIESSAKAKRQLELDNLKMEMKALQAQINPHFLYNTLDSINVLAKRKKAYEISNIIQNLATFLRSSLRKGAELITIEDELSIVHEYMGIQKINYPELFTYEIDVDDSLAQYTIIKNTLQPIVENSIFHGFSDGDRKGTITITTHEESGRLHIEVRDNGAGITDEELKTLNRTLTNGTLTETSLDHGFGIHNVNKRLKLHFGEAAGIICGHNNSQGFIAHIYIPKRGLKPKEL